ncbi:MAG TPA: hypothetical protein ENH10_08505, partial [Bacteroidetes bacterium]|nr:hypothetical protein [Bacteroidota bacterium]HEX05176.1 hypothetical protein [Bacteroidota bacterium]
MSIETVFDNAGMDSLFFEDPFPIQFLDGNYFIDVKQAEVWGMGIDPNGDPYDEHWKIYQATRVEHSTAAGTVYNFIGQLHGDVLFEEVTGGTVCDPCLNYPYDNCCETDIERSYVQYLHLTPGDYRIRIGF